MNKLIGYLIKRINNNKNIIIFFLVIIIILVLNISLSLGFSSYENYLYSDMQGYRTRAYDRFNGIIFDTNQRAIWPITFHIILSNLFKIYNFLNLSHYHLEITIIINILLFIISGYFVYLISLKIFKKQNLAIISGIFYITAYPFIYFNTFILSENFAIPLFIIGFYLLTEKKYLISGIIIGISIIIRPIFGPFIIGIYVFLLINKENLYKFIRNCVYISIGIGSVLIMYISEINYISKGSIKGLGANGGINFYFSRCNIKQANFVIGNKYIYLGPPRNYHEYKKIVVHQQPPYNQKYYFNEGIKCIKNNENIPINIYNKIYNLFFGPLLPTENTIPGYKIIYLYMYINFIGYLLIYIFGFIIHKKEHDLGIIYGFYSILITNIFMIIIFNSEQRYIYPTIFIIYILSVGIINELYKIIKTKLSGLIYLRKN